MLVSIIVPVYKAEQWLHRCIDSILAQTMPDFELLLIDDGSPDKSGEICDEYAAKDSRVRVFHKKNGGVSSARLKGFKESLGEWVMFVDADDLLVVNALSCLVDNSCGVDIVSGGMKIIRELGDGVEREEDFPKHIKEVGTFEGYFYAKQILDGSRLCSVWRQLIKKDILGVDDFFISEDIKVAEDFIFNIKISHKIRKYRGIPDVVYKYRYYSTNTIQSFVVTAEYIDVYFEELNQIFASKEWNVFRKDIFDYKISWLINYLFVKNIENCKFVREIKAEKKNFSLTIRERLALFLIKFENVNFRRFVWLRYNKFVRIIYNFIKK